MLVRGVSPGSELLIHSLACVWVGMWIGKCGVCYVDVYMDGKHRMLALPEFSDTKRAQGLFDTLSHDGLVAGYVDEVTKQDSSKEYMIRIGQEITLEGLEGCSFITTTYNVGGKVAGNIGVIGPKRMEYSKVISQINFVRMMIDEQLNQ